MIIPLSPSAGIPARYANRHGLVTGATGTGKTVTLQTLIEGFSAHGVPVYAADVKGDLSALARSCPARLLDVYGQEGERLSVPVWRMGADLLSRALELSDVQAGCLEIAFAFADSRSAPLDTLADLRATLAAMLQDGESISTEFGLIGAASIGAIQRALLRLETQGAAEFFGAPVFDIADLMVRPGLVSILSAARLLHAPRLYSALMLWLLRDLSQRLPELGDMDRPRLVFVFDEAHTLFSDCPAPLLRSIEQTARLIRSKGVGLYFASQSPEDVPTIIRDQLATRIEHDRALGVGRAWFTTLDDKGMPTARVLVRPALPKCPLGALQPHERPQRATAAPMPVQVQDDMSAAGYAFLAFAALAIAGLVWLISAVTWPVFVATAIGALLAVRKGLA